MSPLDKGIDERGAVLPLQPIACFRSHGLKLSPTLALGDQGNRPGVRDMIIVFADLGEDAVEQAFGADVDYGQAVKFYEAEPIGPGRYSPPRVVRSERTVINGNPDVGHISTSLIERQNLTMRMSMRRFTRLTNGFSKKVENMKAAVSLHFAHYNFRAASPYAARHPGGGGGRER